LLSEIGKRELRGKSYLPLVGPREVGDIDPFDGQLPGDRCVPGASADAADHHRLGPVDFVSDRGGPPIESRADHLVGVNRDPSTVSQLGFLHPADCLLQSGGRSPGRVDHKHHVRNLERRDHALGNCVVPIGPSTTQIVVSRSLFDWAAHVHTDDRRSHFLGRFDRQFISGRVQRNDIGASNRYVQLGPRALGVETELPSDGMAVQANNFAAELGHELLTESIGWSPESHVCTSHDERPVERVKVF
jgi:hypothetical protein